MCSIVVLTGKIGMRSKLYTKRMMGAAEETIAALRELVDGAKVVKFQVWEQSYIDRIRKKRGAELVHLRTVRLLTVVIMGLGRSSPILANCVTFCVLWATSGQLSASVVFPAMQVYQSLRVPFIALPMALPMLLQVAVNAKRVSQYLALPDQPAPKAPAQESDAHSPLIELVDATLGWPKVMAAATPAVEVKERQEEAAAVARRRGQGRSGGRGGQRGGGIVTVDPSNVTVMGSSKEHSGSEVAGEEAAFTAPFAPLPLASDLQRWSR